MPVKKNVSAWIKSQIEASQRAASRVLASKRVSNIEQPVRRLYPEIALLNSLTRSGGGQFEGIVFGDGIRGAPAFRIKHSWISLFHCTSACFMRTAVSHSAIL